MNKKPKYLCPQCKRVMEQNFDCIAMDYYVQCRNMKCNFDGAFGISLAQAAKNCGAIKKKVSD